jgi:hypothetical protein
MESPDTIPVGINFLPAAWLKYGKELQYLIDQYPQFFGGHQVDLDHILESMAPTYHKGTHVDEWGCVWENEIDGAEAIVKGHPLKTEEDVLNLKIPDCRSGRLPHGFMYLRLLDLCGFDNAMYLFGDEDEAIEVLIDKVLQYNIYQVEALMDSFNGLAVFGDDQGTQHGLAIGLDRWRKYLKPCYQKLYGMIKARQPETLIYMHTDGCIHQIMGDLQDCGVDMINPQFRANGLQNLVRTCRRERLIPINLDLDRQLFPFASPEELRSHVRECVEALYLPQGGLSLNVELNYDIPMENCIAILQALEEFRHYR